jgi:hypothetical protein
MQLPRIGGVPSGDVLHGDPVIGREGFYDPPSVGPPDSGVLLAAKRAERQSVHRLIVHMRHPRFETLGETHPSLGITGKDGAGQPIRCVIREVVGVRLPLGANQRSHRAEELFTREGVIVGQVCDHVRRQDPLLRRPPHQLTGAGRARLLDAL